MSSVRLEGGSSSAVVNHEAQARPPKIGEREAQPAPAPAAHRPAALEGLGARPRADAAERAAVPKASLSAKGLKAAQAAVRTGYADFNAVDAWAKQRGVDNLSQHMLPNGDSSIKGKLLKHGAGFQKAALVTGLTVAVPLTAGAAVLAIDSIVKKRGAKREADPMRPLIMAMRSQADRPARAGAQGASTAYAGGENTPVQPGEAPLPPSYETPPPYER